MLSEHLELAVSSGSTVCAYVPVGTEPGSIEMLDMLLRRAATGAAAGCAHHRLKTLRCRCGGVSTGRADLSAGAGGCSSRPSPGCPSPRWPRPSLVIVPALAVDRRGVRLGRGGGFYDRSLSGRDPQARLIAMVRDDGVGRRVAVRAARRADDPRAHAAARGDRARTSRE